MTRKPLPNTSPRSKPVDPPAVRITVNIPPRVIQIVATAIAAWAASHFCR